MPERGREPTPIDHGSRKSPRQRQKPIDKSESNDTLRIMVESLQTRLGRGDYRAADGTEYQDRSCRASDDRWRIKANGQTFVEPDERLAIARFLVTTRKDANCFRTCVSTATVLPAERSSFTNPVELFFQSPVLRQICESRL